MTRRLLRLLLFVALGATTTFATALALAAWMPMEMYPRQRIYHFVAGERAWSGVERKAFGVWNIWWSEINLASTQVPPTPREMVRNSIMTLLGHRHEPDPHWPSTPEGLVEMAREEFARNNARRPHPIKTHDGPPAWGTFASGSAPDPDQTSATVGTDHGFGWPRPALWYTVHGAYLGNYAIATEIQGGYLLTPPSTLDVRAYGFRAIPTRPYWPGIIGNTALFAGAWAVLLLMPGLLRRRLRRRRGRCPACGYDLCGLAGSGCPECGAGRAAPAGNDPEPGT
jgi:hypothetical protein